VRQHVVQRAQVHSNWQQLDEWNKKSCWTLHDAGDTAVKITTNDSPESWRRWWYYERSAPTTTADLPCYHDSSTESQYLVTVSWQTTHILTQACARSTIILPVNTKRERCCLNYQQMMNCKYKKEKHKQSPSWASLKGDNDLHFISPKLDTSRRCQITDIGPAYHVVSFSWQWYTAAIAKIQTQNLVIYHTGTNELNKQRNLWLNWKG